MSTKLLSLTTKPQIRVLHWVRNGLLLLLLFFATLIVSGWMFQSLSMAKDARTFPAPGQLIEMRGFQMHLYCMGERREGTPTVILNASYPATVSSWVWIQPQVASVTRVCAYDRAGEGWSETSPEVPTLSQMAKDLASLLDASGETGPYLLVGHSWGGAVTRLFAVEHPELLSGLVWVEALPEHVAGIPALTSLGVFRAFPTLRGTWGIVPGLPEQQQAELLAYFNTNKWADHIVAVEQAFPESLDQLRRAGDLGDIPLAIVMGSSSEGATGIGLGLQHDLETLSSNSQEYWVEGADHSTLVHDEAYARQTAQVILEMLTKVK